MSRWLQPRQFVLALSVLCMAAAIRSARYAAIGQHAAGQRYEDIYYLPDASWLPVLSLGFRDALADLIWLKSLVYFGEDIGQRGRVQYVFAYTDAVIALDPDYRSAYRWISTAAIYRPGAISMHDGLRAARYLERATERWPNDGELHWDYGSLLRFELAPLERDPHKKRALLEAAAPHLEIAARLGAGPPWLAINNAQLLNKLGRSERAIRQLEELHGTVQAEDIKRDIEYQLARLRTETYVHALRAATDAFEQQRQRSYPYLSSDMFLLVGPRDEPAAYEHFVADSFLEPTEHAEEHEAETSE